MEWVTDDSYGRYFTIDKCRGWFCATHQPDKNGFAVKIELQDLAYLQTVLATPRRILDLDADCEFIAKLFKSGFRDGLQLVEGLRLPGTWSVCGRYSGSRSPLTPRATWSLCLFKNSVTRGVIFHCQTRCCKVI